jgi:hypothetical protein
MMYKMTKNLANVDTSDKLIPLQRPSRNCNTLVFSIPSWCCSQALELRTPLFPHLVPPAIMVWIFVWKYIFEPFIHILQHFLLQISRSWREWPSSYDCPEWARVEESWMCRRE